MQRAEVQSLALPQGFARRVTDFITTKGGEGEEGRRHYKTSTMAGAGQVW